MMMIANVLISASLISFCAWLAQKRPDLAGFIISMPLSTLLVLALTQINGGDAGKSTLLAKSIFVAIPSTLVFFIPFFFAAKLRLPFWGAYGIGVALLGVAYFLHRSVFALLAR